jgi:hypothetical protein
MSDEYEDHEGMTPSERARDDFYRQRANVTAPEHPAIRAWRESVHLGMEWHTLHTRGDALAAALEASEAALRRIAASPFDRDDAPINLDRARQIARDALERR